MTYKTLVLPGNGIKGLYTLGALEKLGELGHLNAVENYVAVSSGSLIAAMLIMGLRPVDILARILSKGLFKKVGRVSMTGIAGGSSIFNFDPIEKELTAIFMDSMGFVPTFSEFHANTERTFVCLGYDATHHELLYFSKDTFPDLSVVSAIRASCAFPLLFDAVPIEDRFIFDGGVGCNYPLAWTCANFPAGPILTVHVGTAMKPITKDTSRLTALKELISYVIRRPDLDEMEKCHSKVAVVSVAIAESRFFDFSNPDRVYMAQFDDGYHLCRIKDKPLLGITQTGV